MSNQPEPDYKAIWDELKDFAKKAPPHEPAWHIAWGAVVEKMRDLETAGPNMSLTSKHEQDLQDRADDLNLGFEAGRAPLPRKEWKEVKEQMGKDIPT